MHASDLLQKYVFTYILMFFRYEQPLRVYLYPTQHVRKSPHNAALIEEAVKRPVNAEDSVTFQPYCTNPVSLWV